MNEQEIQSANIQLDFTNVESAEGSYTKPGTIALFTITEGEYVTSKKKGTPGVKLTFKEDSGSTFSHTFHLTENALSRIQHVAKHAIDKPVGDKPFTSNPFSGQLTPANIIASLKGKILPLKVTAQINEENARVYANLSYGGFSANSLAELKFSQKELEEIAKGEVLSERTNIAAADSETGSGSEANVAEESDTSQDADEF